MQDNRAVCERYESDVIGGRRNPYLVDYEEQRRRAARRNRERQREAARTGNTSAERQREAARTGYTSAEREPVRRSAAPPVSRQQRREAMMARRRRQVRRQKIAVGIWALSILLIGGILLFDRDSASAAGSVHRTPDPIQEQGTPVSIQGLAAETFNAHPKWTEDLLTPNPYSRPQRPLTEVRDIFVHYTANPETTAAQNRSYFEQQKDMQERSVSAHFIIDISGEIIQCVPLDEIAFAVKTRNDDSISIECCYSAEDGSFTQETYDSLIALLAWLTDAYDLDTEHILRHYDCGGKKCPLYYTEHEDAWEQLKKDVEDYRLGLLMLSVP